MPHAWFDTLFQALCFMGFTKSRANSSIFFNFTTDTLMYLLVYMYDIIIIEGNGEIIKKFIDTLNSTFSLKYMGLLQYFLGIEISELENDDMLLT